MRNIQTPLYVPGTPAPCPKLAAAVTPLSYTEPDSIPPSVMNSTSGMVEGKVAFEITLRGPMDDAILTRFETTVRNKAPFAEFEALPVESVTHEGQEVPLYRWRMSKDLHSPYNDGRGSRAADSQWFEKTNSWRELDRAQRSVDFVCTYGLDAKRSI